MPRLLIREPFRLMRNRTKASDRPRFSQLSVRTRGFQSGRPSSVAQEGLPSALAVDDVDFGVVGVVRWQGAPLIPSVQ